MAEEKKKNAQDLYKAVVDFYNNSDRTDEEFAEDYPGIYSLLNSPMDSLQRQKLFGDSLKKSSFLGELRDIDKINEGFDFSDYEKDTDDTAVSSPVKIGSRDDDGKSIWDKESMDGVNLWYNKAKEVLDPGHKLKNTELYEIFSDDKLQRLQDMQEGERDYWFTELLNGMGYTDDDKGIEALSRDLETVLTRKKNADFADKYGKGKTPLKFLFGNVFEAMEDGRKPSLGDYSADVLSNAAWAVPGSKILGGLGSVKKLGKIGEVLHNVEYAKSIPGKIGRNTIRASIAPVANEAVDSIFGTDTSEEIQDGLSGRAQNAVLNTAINWATPLVAKSVLGRMFSLGGNAGLSQKEASEAMESIFDFVDFGSKQETALQKLRLNKEMMDSAEETVQYFAKRLGKKDNNLDESTLAEVISELPRRLQKNGTALSRMIIKNGGDLPLGAGEFIGSFDNLLDSELLKNIANSHKSMLDEALPFVVNYGMNRLGTSGFGGWLMNRAGRTARPWTFEEKEE